MDQDNVIRLAISHPDSSTVYTLSLTNAAATAADTCNAPSSGHNTGQSVRNDRNAAITSLTRHEDMSSSLPFPSGDGRQMYVATVYLLLNHAKLDARDSELPFGLDYFDILTGSWNFALTLPSQYILEIHQARCHFNVCMGAICTRPLRTHLSKKQHLTLKIRNQLLIWTTLTGS